MYITERTPTGERHVLVRHVAPEHPATKTQCLYVHWVVRLLAAGSIGCVLLFFVAQAASAAGPADGAADFATAMLAIERGRIQAERASLETDGNRRLLLWIEARQSFQRAATVLQTLEETAEGQVQRLGGAWDIAADASSSALLQVARREGLQSGLCLAGVWHAMGKTYPLHSVSRQRYLTAAAKKYETIYRQHATLAGGLCARICQACVVKELDQPREAVEILEGMLNLPDNDEAFRRLRNEALGLLLETYLLPEVKDYTLAMRRAEQWIATSRTGDPTEPGALRAYYLAGLATLEFVRSLPPGVSKRGESLRGREKAWSLWPDAEVPCNRTPDVPWRIRCSATGSTRRPYPGPLRNGDIGAIALGTHAAQRGRASPAARNASGSSRPSLPGAAIRSPTRRGPDLLSFLREHGGTRCDLNGPQRGPFPASLPLLGHRRPGTGSRARRIHRPMVSSKQAGLLSGGDCCQSLPIACQEFRLGRFSTRANASGWSPSPSIFPPVGRGPRRPNWLG